MPNHDYAWLFAVGFCIGLGLIQAFAVASAVIYAVGKIVNALFAVFEKDDVSKHAFTVLPAHYNSMTVVYNSKTKELKAIAAYAYKGQINTRTASRYITDVKGLELFAQELQLTLMANIASEIKNAKPLP